MLREGPGSLALIVRGRPYRHRAARADLDMVLAAAAMDFRIEVYFLGGSVMQLVAHRDSSPALLPSGYRAWAALPDLAEVGVYAEREWLKRCEWGALPLLLPVQARSAAEMQASWRRCRHILMV
jgi:sulfur relay (sulfurtransferase) DsrF/TusC family protein